MAEITTASATATSASTAPITAPKPVASTKFSLQGIENTVFTFLQAHYAKVIAVIVGYATSSYGLIGKLLGKIF
jgi:hypothetical protein